MNRINEKFKELKSENKKAFIAFITSGDPSLDKTAQLVKALEKAGVDILELGVPFSDPLADGPTIQLASQRALSKGVNLKKIFALVENIRRESQIPIALMTYYNLVLSYGIEKFAIDCQKNGVDGVIVPDLPIEEAEELYKELKKRAMCFIPFISPTSTAPRKIKTASLADGFIYYVSLTGVTGARKKLDSSLIKDLTETKKITKDKPLAVGFGISTVGQVKEIKPYCDGVIVGSAIVKIIEENQTSGNLAQKVETFVGQLVKAVHK